jgi:hypothetical protein
MPLGTAIETPRFSTIVPTYIAYRTVPSLVFTVYDDCAPNPSYVHASLTVPSVDVRGSPSSDDPAESRVTWNTGDDVPMYRLSRS